MRELLVGWSCTGFAFMEPLFFFVDFGWDKELHGVRLRFYPWRFLCVLFIFLPEGIGRFGTHGGTQSDGVREMIYANLFSSIGMDGRRGLYQREREYLIR